MLTVVDLFPASSARATGMNADGWVCGWAAGLVPFLWMPDSANSAAGTTAVLQWPLGLNGQAMAVNANRDVVGWGNFQSPQGPVELGAFWGWNSTAGQQLMTLVTGNLGSCHANGLNDVGEIVGWSDSETLSGAIGPRHAVRWDSFHSIVELVGLDANLESEAMGINNNSVIVGKAQMTEPVSGDVVNHAVRWDPPNFGITDMGTLAAVLLSPFGSERWSATAAAINDDRIVGVSDVALALLTLQPARSSFYVPVAGGSLVPILAGSSMVGAWAVSPNETVAITLTTFSFTAVLEDHGGTYSDASGVLDVNTTSSGLPPNTNRGLPGGWLLTEATGVNDFGEVCGRGSSVAGQDHAILLVP